jgi:hypothetical protein
LLSELIVKLDLLTIFLILVILLSSLQMRTMRLGILQPSPLKGFFEFCLLASLNNCV